VLKGGAAAETHFARYAFGTYILAKIKARILVSSAIAATFFALLTSPPSFTWKAAVKLQVSLYEGSSYRITQNNHSDRHTPYKRLFRIFAIKAATN